MPVQMKRHQYPKPSTIDLSWPFDLTFPPMRTFNPHGWKNIETRRDFIKRSASAGAGFALSRAWARSGIAATPDLDPAVVKKFGATLNGQLILPGDPSYDKVRHIVYGNSKTAKHPAVIARCANAEDVRRSVEFAHQHDLLVAVRSGGHST